jgi:hypothetical protein
MRSRDFCFWLQGYLEIASAEKPTTPAMTPTLTTEQLECVRRHLALVFKHEIDPSMGGPEHQTELDAVHKPPQKPAIGGVDQHGNVIRC